MSEIQVTNINRIRWRLNMAMTAYKASNYDFHEETLHDIVPEVTNDTTRTVLHNELVMLDGFFGEVADYDGIGTGLVGNININS